MMTLASSDKSKLLHQLSKAEKSFLSAVGLNNLSKFESQWSLVHDVLDKDLELDESTLSVANNVAARIGMLASSFVDIETHVMALDTVFNSDMNSILDSLSALDVSSASSLPEPLPSSVPAPTDSARHGHPSERTGSTFGALPDGVRGRRSTPSRYHILPSWLLQHMHNPYPNLADKKILADSSNLSIKSVEEWFSNCRRKIGWARISNRYFGGNRSLTIDCAYRILVEHIGHLYYSQKIVQEIEDMKEAVERICEGQIEQSGFAKRLESTNLPPTQDTATKGRKRRRRASPSSDCESVTSSSASSTGESSRKRSRGTTEERDCTPSSPKRDSIHSRSSSSLSHTASFTSCSSASSASSPGPLTPLSSPTETYAKLPTDIFNNWIDDVISEPMLLPPDAVDQPCSVLSQKRVLSDSDFHHTAKRARLEQPPAPSATTPVSHAATLPEDNGPLSIANELALSMPPLLEILPIAGEGDASVFGNLPPLKDANPDLFSHFITQLEREVPSASTWDDSLLGGSAVEAVPFNFGGSATEASNANTQPTSSVVDFFSLFGLEGAAGQDNSEAANNPLLEGQAKGVSEAVLLSSTDLAFLDGLGGSEDGDPDTWSTCADAPGDTDSPATLIDTLSSSQEPEVEDEERTKKLRRLQELLEEAEKLKQEVYG